jgi:nucleotide-binding universal stress UspA family protein
MLRRMGPIVVGTDGSPGAMLAVRRAATIAAGPGATVHLVTAIPEVSLREPIASSARTENVSMGAVAEDVLARARHALEEAGVAVETHTERGDPAHVILDVAERIDAELIVVGARGLSGLQRFLLGSVSTKVSHYARTSVMVVRPPEG